MRLLEKGVVDGKLGCWRRSLRTLKRLEEVIADVKEVGGGRCGR